MENSTTTTISIEPNNDMKIAMNVANKLFDNQSSISPSDYNLCLQVAKLTIQEMESNNLTSYEGNINNA